MREAQERPPALGTPLPLWPGAAPGSETWTWSDQVVPTDDGRLVRNVAVSTVEAFPQTAAQTGMAAIIAPGGAWTFLMVDKEGADLARRLAARGIWALVLRYRVQRTPADDAGFAAFSEELWRGIHAPARLRCAHPWDAGSGPDDRSAGCATPVPRLCDRR